MLTAKLVPLEHIYKEETVKDTPCVEVKKITCTDCGLEETQETVKQNHEYTSEITQEPTCQEEGVLTYTCSLCGDTYTERIHKSEHEYDSEITKEPTCSSEGEKAYKCKVCGDTYTEPIEADKTAHQYEAEVVVAPSCTKIGASKFTCKLCGNSYLKVMPTDNEAHTFVSEVTKNPTCSEEGIKILTCTECGEKVSALIDKNPEAHEYTSSVVRYPTCIQNGLELLTCSLCGNVEAMLVDKLDHVYVEKITKKPTCTEKGEKSFTCSSCGYSYTEEINVNKNEHSYRLQVTTKPSCISEGKKIYICDYCGDTKYESIAKLSHSYTKKTNKATFSKDGSISCVCKNCGYVSSSTSVYKANVSLSATRFAYNGSQKMPVVTVKNSKGNVLKKDTDYTLSYPSSRTDIGRYKIKVTLKGNYTGTTYLYFDIVPKSTTIKKFANYSTCFRVYWNTQTNGTSGYQIRYSKNSNFSFSSYKTVSGNNKSSLKISGLSRKTTYYVKIRTYKTVTIDGKSVKLYSSWSNAKSVKTK